MVLVIFVLVDDSAEQTLEIAPVIVGEIGAVLQREIDSRLYSVTCF